MFDPDFDMPSEQVHELWCVLEKRFAESTVGIVSIHSAGIIKNSVLDQISIPALMKNNKAHVFFIDN